MWFQRASGGPYRELVAGGLDRSPYWCSGTSKTHALREWGLRGMVRGFGRVVYGFIFGGLTI